MENTQTSTHSKQLPMLAACAGVLCIMWHIIMYCWKRHWTRFHERKHISAECIYNVNDMYYAQCNTCAHNIQLTHIEYMLQSSHLIICTHPLHMHPDCWLCFPAAPRELCIAVVFTTSQIIQYPDAAYVGIPCNLNANRSPRILNAIKHITMCWSSIDLPTACSTHI